MDSVAMWTRNRAETEWMLILFKFGQVDHLTAFREQGLMHMRTMRYFAEQERENPARGDRFEGAAVIIQPPNLRMTFEIPTLGTHEVDPSDLVGPVILSYNEEAHQNIFCMFSLSEPTAKPLLNGEHLNFGSHFVLILNASEFLKRIQRTLLSMQLQGKAGPVEYYDEATYSGAIGPFRKPKRFAYQKEYRFVVKPGIAPFRNLIVGDISDITSPVLPLSELDRVVDFSEDSAIAAGWSKSK